MTARPLGSLDGEPARTDLLERYRSAMAPFLSPYYEHPIAIERGEGSWLWDQDGGKYLDFWGGVLTTMVGHAHPRVTRAIQEQASRVMHVSSLYLSEPMIELAERIAALSGIPDARVFFTPSGSEANDAALLLATSYRRSNQILAMRNSYHGRSFAAQAVTSHSSWLSTRLSGFAVSFVQGPYRLRSPFRELDDEAYIQACCDDLRQTLHMSSSGDVAAMIAEPIQGVGGFAVPPDGFYGAMKEILDDRGILFISDEVQTGWGRTGDHFWGYQAHGLVPDMLTFAKGIGNGIALAGVVARKEIMETVDVTHFSTFGGDPISAVAGLATLDVLERDGVLDNVGPRGAELRVGLDELAEARDWVGEVRGKGLMHAMELVQPGTIDPWPEMATRLLEATRDQGLLVGKGGLHGNVLRIAPMLNVRALEVEDGLARMKTALNGVVPA